MLKSRESSVRRLQLFQIGIGIFPDTLKFIVIQKKMNHAVKMVGILQFCFIEADQPQIAKIFFLSLKFWNNGNLEPALPRKLIPQ